MKTGRFFAVIVIGWVMLSFISFGYSRGDGSEGNPFQIADANDLLELSADTGNYDKCFILTGDIDLTGRTFTSAIIAPDISSSSNFQGTQFNGIFDGDDHIISNLTIFASTKDFMGLFGYVKNATIKNLGIENVSLSTGGCYAGGLVGYQSAGTINNCYSIGSVVSSTKSTNSVIAGGLVGVNDEGSIISSYSKGLTITYSDFNVFSCAGGLVGGIQNGTIADCFSISTVDSSSLSELTYAGGLVGKIYSGTVTNCHSTGTITSSFYAGGLIGSSQGTIIDSYSTSNVYGENFVGGLVGSQFIGNVTSSYHNGTVHGVSYVGGLIGEYYHGSITACYSGGEVNGDSQIGGLVGRTDNLATLTSCYSTAAVQGDSHVGGLVGYHDCYDHISGWPHYSNIISCYATGQVTGNSCVGGLVGTNSSNIKYCYSIGSISGTSNTGGLIGKYDPPVVKPPYTYSPSIVNNFWDEDTSGQSFSAGGSGRTTVQMKTFITFTSAGWDFADTWAICEGTNYPRLQWQIPTEDWVCPDGENVEDLDYFVGRWLLSNCTSSNNYCGGGDVDMSGNVDLEDFSIFAQHWLEGL